MNKFFVSVGLAAAGTASVQIPSAHGQDLQDQRLWSVSASLRGFYDDNYDTLTTKKGSLGFEVSPTLNFSIPMQQTEFGMRYTYALYYYEDRQSAGVNPIDQSHQVDLWLDHAFTERWHAKLQDTLAIGQEPELLQGGTPYRVNGNNVANTVTLAVNTDWTRLFSTAVTLQNKYFDFQDSGHTVADLFPNATIYGPSGPFNFPPDPTTYGPYNGTGLGPSLAGLLNRIENSFALDLQWHVAPETMLFVGYQFQQVNYTGNEPIAYNPYYTGVPQQSGPPFYYSSDRDNRSHYGYVGIDQTLRENLSVNVRAGVQYVDDYKDLLDSPSVSPYAQLSLIYTYLPGCYAQIGVNHGQNATDVASVGTNGKITQSQESTAGYLTINQRITSKLLGTLILNAQYSDFRYGAYSSQPDVEYNLGVNFKYSFNKHFSGEFGYNFDDLQSGIDQRSYIRNRVYLGVGAAY